MKIEDIKNPEFLQKLSKKEMKNLCSEIRSFLIEKISRTGGHLASNLGVVELTVALHYVFNSSKDKIIFDVGHQAYTHKILTGRASMFDSLRKTDGLSGFTNYDESSYDVYESGHSSNSLSALAGFLLAKQQNNEDINDCVSVIGDASISSGLAFEGLNFLSTIKEERPIIILNDNKMSISKSVGSTSKIFTAMRGSKFYRGLKKFLLWISPGFIGRMLHRIKKSIQSLFQNDNIFEEMGYDYFGPYDGNNISQVIKILKIAKASTRPCVIHFVTKKGLGFEPAENDDFGSYHAVGPFDLKTGKSINTQTNKISYSQIVSDTLISIRRERPFTLINPATIVGSKLSGFQHEFPQSIYDVGIAEEHAATMAGAIALNKHDVALLMYSTFAQRAYDQILNDIARRNLHVVMGFDRAGLVPEDGSTHQGIYDVAMLNSMPNIKILMGRNLAETKALLEYAFKMNSPVVVRYPKALEEYTSNIIIENTNWDVLTKGKRAYVISYGPICERIYKLIVGNNLKITLINARFINIMDQEILNTIYKDKNKVLVVEEVIKRGSLASLILENASMNQKSIKLSHLAIDSDSFIKHASYDDLLKEFSLDDESILRELKMICD